MSVPNAPPNSVDPGDSSPGSPPRQRMRFSNEDAFGTPTQLSVARALLDSAPNSSPLSTPERILLSNQTNKNDRRHLWLITVNGYNPEKDHVIDHEWLFGSIEQFKVREMSSQYEKAPTTETRHVHVFVNFNKPVRFSTLVDHVQQKFGIHPNISWVKKVNKRSAKAYCNKKRTRDCTPSKVYTYPTKEDNGDQRTVAQKLYDHLMVAHGVEVNWTYSWTKIYNLSSTELKILMITNKSVWKRHFDEQRALWAPMRIIKNVLVFFGAPGVGKTHFVKNNPEYFGVTPEDDEPWLFCQDR